MASTSLALHEARDQVQLESLVTQRLLAKHVHPPLAASLHNASLDCRIQNPKLASGTMCSILRTMPCWSKMWQRHQAKMSDSGRKCPAFPRIVCSSDLTSVILPRCIVHLAKRYIFKSGYSTCHLPDERSQAQGPAAHEKSW